MVNKKNTIRFWVGRVHLWLGLASGLIVCFLGITGCILAFEREIENSTQSYRFTPVQNQALLPPSALKDIGNKALPGKKDPHSISYQPGKSAAITYYHANPDYYYVVYADPYSGKVLKVKNMDEDFFRIVINGHFYLWLPPEIGQPIVASATLIFVVMLISGLVLWWPRNKAASKQRFSIKFNAKWRRVNYDLHNVLGFYMTWILIFIAFTGLVWGFQWFAKSVYWVSSGGKQQKEFHETLSDASGKLSYNNAAPAIDVIWDRTRKAMPGYTGSIDVHVPETDSSSIEIALNPDTDTYWKADYIFYDQYTLKELPIKHAYGRLSQASVADKISRMNYDIHVGAVLGLPGKIIAFFASLVAASLPVTGVIVWWGRKKKAKRAKKTTPALQMA
ncbi:PepSY domain-containing protein [Mucilaginibacter hurinus]|uniref:PepSY domain-containing protein n=1 Tax=Mucilaginibacter hurinus TaxID=2201324 RepID=A0A367GQI1_9SPHI|nr:PepSY-associated TM helix domain-containing protein [Mucilaginibacter hurinus]RCH55520.1 PepSY domain-containing protein [Mucilaginibacter hurinus]